MISKNYKNKANKTSHWLNRESPTLDHIKLISRYLKIKKPNTLDVGCAEGENTNIFAASGFNVVGLDYNARLLSLAKKNHPKINFELGNVEKLKYKSETFDFVYCINTLFYVDLRKSLSEILRITKIGGLAFITLDISITDLDKDKIIHRSSLKELKDIIKESGEILYMKKRQRTDLTPFKHVHRYYDLLIRRV